MFFTIPSVLPCRTSATGSPLDFPLPGEIPYTISSTLSHLVITKFRNADRGHQLLTTVATCSLMSGSYLAGNRHLSNAVIPRPCRHSSPSHFLGFAIGFFPPAPCSHGHDFPGSSAPLGSSSLTVRICVKCCMATHFCTQQVYETLLAAITLLKPTK